MLGSWLAFPVLAVDPSFLLGQSLGQQVLAQLFILSLLHEKPGLSAWSLAFVGIWGVSKQFRDLCVCLSNKYKPL